MRGHQYCDLIGRFITIQSNGDFLPCCESEHHGWPVLGNAKSQNLQDILSSNIYQDTLNRRQPYCIRCTEWHNLQIDFDTKCKKVTNR